MNTGKIINNSFLIKCFNCTTLFNFSKPFSAVVFDPWEYELVILPTPLFSPPTVNFEGWTGAPERGTGVHAVSREETLQIANGILV